MYSKQYYANGYNYIQKNFISLGKKKEAILGIGLFPKKPQPQTNGRRNKGTKIPKT